MYNNLARARRTSALSKSINLFHVQRFFSSAARSTAWKLALPSLLCGITLRELKHSTESVQYPSHQLYGIGCIVLCAQWATASVCAWANMRRLQTAVPCVCVARSYECATTTSNGYFSWCLLLAIIYSGWLGSRFQVFQHFPLISFCLDTSSAFCRCAFPFSSAWAWLEICGKYIRCHLSFGEHLVFVQ